MKTTPTVKKKSIRESNQKLTFGDSFRLVYIGVSMCFVGGITSVYFAFRTMIPLTDFIGIFILIPIICVFIVRSFFKTIFPMKRMELLAFVTFGCTPVILALVLSLNYYISQETKVLYCKVRAISGNSYNLYFEVDELPCKDFPELCRLEGNDIVLRKGEIIKITVCKGIFGYPVLRDVELMPQT